MRKTPASKRRQLLDVAENGLLIAVGVGSIIAVSTQQIGWGLIPGAIALIFNRFKRQQEQNTHLRQFHHLEKLIQSYQTEQENQQTTLSQLQEKVENNDYQVAIEELRQDLDEARSRTSTNHSLEAELEKINQLIRQNQQRQTELETQLSQIQESAQSLGDSTSASSQEQINRLESSLQKFTQYQTEENHYYQKAIQQLKQELDTARSGNSSSHSSDKINRLENFLRQLIQLVNSLTQRQTEKNQALETKLNELQLQLDQLNSGTLTQEKNASP